MTTETIEASAAAVVPVATPEAPKPHVLAEQLPPEALKARLDAAKATARTDLLKELGVTDAEQLKTALASIAAAAEAKKTDAEKLAGHLSELERARSTLTEATTAIGLIWADESAKLTADQLAAVTELAGDSVTARVKTLAVMRKTWATQAAQSAQTAATATTAAPTVPATTSPSGNAPAPTTTSPTDHKAVYEQLSKSNPIQAARYLNAHEREIFPA